MNNIPLIIRLYWEFFKTGLFSIGGGLATLPFLSSMAEKTGWFTQVDLANMVAIAESTPGPMGINTATYVGYTTAGMIGGIIATLGLITPSIIIILLIASILNKFKESRIVKVIFYFLRPTSCALIFSAFISLSVMAFFPKEDFSIPALILGISIFLLTNFFDKTKKLHPVFWIAASAVIGIILF